MGDSITGYLLTRGWRDTPQGVELTFWGSTHAGPVRLVIEEQEAVCFINRFQSLSLPARTRREPRELKLLGGAPVDALYFQQQHDLQTLRKSGVALAESDVKPADRYLMERFVRAGFEATGNEVDRDGVRTLLNPRLRKVDVQPTLRVLSLDIETRGNSDQLYSIAEATIHETNQETAASVFMIGDAENELRDGYMLRYFQDERVLLLTFFEWLKIVDPALIIGWSVVNFGLDFLHRKCRLLGVRFAMGRGNETSAILQAGNPGQPHIARVPGRSVLDGIALLKAGYWALDSFSLDNVAHQLLGDGKLIPSDKNKMAEINR